jgi:glucose 1-dehydrogenase
MATRGLLENQRAVVTGASSGIGAAIARALGEAGASVIVNYHSDEAGAQATVAAIAAAGGKAGPVQADVSRPEDCARLFDAADAQFGGVDIAILNAGIQADAAFTEMTLEQWQRVIGVNLTGQFLCAQHAVRRFRKQGIDPARSQALGKIVFTSSVHQRIAWAGHVNYAASKGGLKLLMESMAQELSPEKIRVNAIAPGAIETDINRPAWTTEAARTELLKLIPYGRVGVPEDVGRVAAWLASDEADYVVGTTIFVDGGMTLYPAFRGGG